MELGVAGRHEPAVHQRKGVVGQSGARPGDKAAGKDRQRDQHEHGFASPPPAGTRSRNRRTADKAERRPQDRGIDRQSESEVGDEAVLADLDPVGKAALDHIPAERALQKPEEQDAGERRRETPRQLPPRQKPEERHGKRHADQPAQQPVVYSQ